RNAETLLLDKSRKEVIQHRMYREHHIRPFRLDKTTDVLAHFRVEKFALVWTRNVDKTEITAHPLRPIRQKQIVNVRQRTIYPGGFFQRFSNLDLKSCRSGCAFDSSSRAVVSLPRIGGQD